MHPRYWLMKSEPETFGIEDLKKAHRSMTSWEGVRNYQARNFMRDQFQIGDLAFLYHSNCKVPAIVGIMEVVSTAYPDPTALDKRSPYYDPKSSASVPRWFLVDVKFKEQFASPIALSALKMNPALSAMQLLQKGNRLSILPISPTEWRTILKMT